MGSSCIVYKSFHFRAKKMFSFRADLQASLRHTYTDNNTLHDNTKYSLNQHKNSWDVAGKKIAVNNIYNGDNRSSIKDAQLIDLTIRKNILQVLQFPWSLGRWTFPLLVFCLCKLLPYFFYHIALWISTSPKIQSLNHDQKQKNHYSFEKWGQGIVNIS